MILGYDDVRTRFGSSLGTKNTEMSQMTDSHKDNIFKTRANSKP